jgi:trans-aconitate methyltransferase
MASKEARPMRLDERVPEPELMEDPEQARAYSEADFASAHDAIVADLLARFPDLGLRSPLSVVDLGCGPGDVLVRLARALPHATVTGLDAGPTMLGLARARIAAEDLDDRVRLFEGRVEGLQSAGFGPVGLVTSNSLLHHLRQPLDLWRGVRTLAGPGTVVHVADLCRPADTAEVDALVRREADGAPVVLREDFRRSLMAAYRPAEVVEQLLEVGLADHLRVDEVSDRHLVVWGRLPG